jgi:hypothetical protein
MASKFIETYNLSHVMKDLERVYFSLPITLNCTKVSGEDRREPRIEDRQESEREGEEGE